jgi:hypothetical protein
MKVDLFLVLLAVALVVTGFALTYTPLVMACHVAAIMIVVGLVTRRWQR